MKHLLITGILIVALSGCTTTQLPDGRTETRLDLPEIEAMLSSAILLYNVYATAEAVPEPSRLTELLDNVDRILDIVNYVRAGQGLEPIEISKGATVEIVEESSNP
jgi:uncharacterized protein YkwD